MIIEDGDEVLVVGLLRRFAVRVDHMLWHELASAGFSLDKQCSSSARDLIKVLSDSRILVGDSFDELEFIRQQSAVARADRGVYGLIVVPTLSCNMACHYCFERKSGRLERDVSGAADQIVKFASDQIRDSQTEALYVRWFGGEPLLNPGLVKNVTGSLQTMVKRLGKKFSSDIVTNGYFLDGDMARSLSALGLAQAQVTLDGGQTYHDKIRRHGKEGSFDRIVENIRACEGFIDVTMRIHVTPHTVNDIYNLLHDLHHRSLHTILKKIYFAPLFNFKQGDPRRQFQGTSATFMSSEHFARHQVDLSKRARELDFQVPDPLDADYGVCTALREATAVLHADGSLAKCYLDAGDLDESYGAVDHGVTTTAKLDKWRSRDFTEDLECAQCVFAPVCLGGCTKKHMSNPDKRFVCTPLRYNANEILPMFY